MVELYANESLLSIVDFSTNETLLSLRHGGATRGKESGQAHKQTDRQGGWHTDRESFLPSAFIQPACLQGGQLADRPTSTTGNKLRSIAAQARGLRTSTMEHLAGTAASPAAASHR